MQLVVALWCLTVVVGASAVAVGASVVGCDVTICSHGYRAVDVSTDIEYPFSMAVDHKTNVLYFSYHDRSFLAGKINLTSSEFSRIEELTGPCSFTVDQVRHSVYAGCSIFEVGNPGGLYQYDSNIGRFVVIAEENNSVEFIHYKDVLYYSLERFRLLRTYSSGRTAPVQELPSEVLNMVIDKDNDKIFYNSSGLFLQKSESLEEIHYEGIRDPMALAVDATGDTYVCDYKTANMYLLHKHNSSFTFVIGVSRCHGITFDKDGNMIYSNIGEHRISGLQRCW